jgi:dethiobiotin synthetase
VSIFVTGTDTGVGKTFTATRLLRLLCREGIRAVGMKPICCGDRQDAEELLAASSSGITIDELNPVWLKTPAAPFPASAVEGVEVAIETLVVALRRLQQRFDFVVVEGVGGWLVPLTRDRFVSDLAAAMQLPVLIVAMNRLGCLNHTMLTIRNVAAAGCSCVGVALNSPAENAADFAATTNRDVLTEVAGVQIVSGLADAMESLPAEWRQILRISPRSP